MKDDINEEYLEQLYEEKDKVSQRLMEAKQLLKEALDFMNLVPNNMITTDGEIVDEDLDDPRETINHYELCSRVDKFLKEI